MKQKLLFLALFLCTSLMWVQKTTAQTLSAGDIAFIGYNTDDPDGFSFITLKEIPAGETIYFSEQGWSGTAWLPNAETHLQWTTSFSLSSGTIVSIIETSTDTFTVTGGGSVSIVVNSGFSLVAGDQVLAYQSSSGPAPASPIFIAGVHGDYNSTNYNSTTHWNATTVNGGSESVVPTGLINGVNCVSLFPGVTEINNAKYNGTLTGTANDIRASINNYLNWISAEPAQYDITPSAYPTPNITTVTPCALTATISSQTNVACYGGSTGMLSVTASGGTPNYTYAWSNGSTTTNTSSTTNSINFLTAGTYSVTITDGNGCTATANATITQPTSALTATTSKTDVSCNGGTNGTASVSVSGGTSTYSYSWAPSGGTNATATGLAAGTYTCTITDANSCQITRSVTVDEPSVLSLTASSQTNIACNGGATGAASVNAATGGAGGYTYNWTPGNPTGDGTTSV
uniref:SprB repeat-containing protein n=1 Tax=Flavobacterium alkalisoli TaxID=2602769 RepID=UPI003A8D8877